MVESARTMADSPGSLEIVARIDEYDLSSGPEARSLGLRTVEGRRSTVAEMWNEAARVASGDLLMLANDDIVFRTPRWDLMVEAAFDETPDRILLVHGDDLSGHGREFGPHPIVSRRWVDVVGRFVPGEFAGNYTDTWLNDVANILGRRRFLPFVVEHLHFLWNKAEYDATYRERDLAEMKENWAARYTARSPEREAEAARLREAIREGLLV